MVFACVVMLLNLGIAHSEESALFYEMAPVTAMVFALTYLVFRTPFREYRHWELPFMVTAVALAFLGGLHFQPEGPGESWAFRIFFASFLGLAVSYGIFCTAVPSEHPLRAEVIEKTKSFSHIGLPGLDIGLVFAPFVFPVFLAVYGVKKRNMGASAKEIGGKPPSSLK